MNLLQQESGYKVLCVCVFLCSILYISLHRFDGGTFFPGSQDGDHNMVGRGQGKGFNVNIPWHYVSVQPRSYSMPSVLFSLLYLLYYLLMAF